MNFSEALGLSGFLSGWCFRAAFLTKRLCQYDRVEQEQEDEQEQEESLPVGFLDFILGRLGFYAESIVELCFCYHFGGGCFQS